MKKIKVQTRLPVLAVILISVIAIVVCGFLVHLVYFSGFASSRTKSDGAELIFFIFVILPLLYKSTFSKEDYLSHILLYDDSLILVYKQGAKEVSRKEVYYSDIQSFNITSDLSTKRYGRSYVCICATNSVIKLKNGNTISFNHDSTSQLFGCPYQYVLDIIKESNRIPDFQYKLKGDNELAKEDINYFARFGKRMPFWIILKYSTKQMSKAGKIVFGIYICMVFLGFGVVIYMFLPSMPLKANEKQYMVHYNKANDLRLNKQNHESIKELEIAKTYAADNPEVYLELAYNYKMLKEYQKAIDCAKEGLKYVNNTNSPYRKYHNFKFLGKKDISLYSLIADCAQKLNNYQEAIEAYTYIIEHSRYAYDDSHFWRGYCYYYAGQIEQSHKDFLEHKEVILKYFKHQRESEYKDTYPKYNKGNLDNVNLWIKATTR